MRKVTHFLPAIKLFETNIPDFDVLKGKKKYRGVMYKYHTPKAQYLTLCLLGLTRSSLP